MITVPELRLLRSFLAVAEQRSFTRAGRKLHISQQSVSEAVRKLEAQLGVKLITRSPRGVGLTTAGQTLALELPDALAGIERAVIRTGIAPGNLSGTISIGCSFDLETDLRDLLKPVSMTFPRLELTVTVAGQTDLVHGLKDGHVDLALTWQLSVDDDQLVTAPLISEPLVVLLRAGHPLADGQPFLAPQALAPYTLIMHRRDVAPGPYDAMLEQLAQHHVTPRTREVEIYSSGHTARLDAVCDGDDVALVAARVLNRPHPPDGVRVIATSPPMHVGIIWAHPANSPSAEAVINAAGQLSATTDDAVR